MILLLLLLLLLLFIDFPEAVTGAIIYNMSTKMNI